MGSVCLPALLVLPCVVTEREERGPFFYRNRGSSAAQALQTSHFHIRRSAPKIAGDLWVVDNGGIQRLSNYRRFT